MGRVASEYVMPARTSPDRAAAASGKVDGTSVALAAGAQPSAASAGASVAVALSPGSSSGAGCGTMGPFHTLVPDEAKTAAGVSGSASPVS
eukprot:6516131-Prymnesium_polylepis.1